MADNLASASRPLARRALLVASGFVLGIATAGLFLGYWRIVVAALIGLGALIILARNLPRA